jgi:hypothetical protein
MEKVQVRAPQQIVVEDEVEEVVVAIARGEVVELKAAHSRQLEEAVVGD